MYDITLALTDDPQKAELNKAWQWLNNNQTN